MENKYVQDSFVEIDDEIEVSDDERLFDITEALDEDIIFHNIEEGFKPDELSPTNYITEYKEMFLSLYNAGDYQDDRIHLKESLIRLSDIVVDQLEINFGITITNKINDENYMGGDLEYLDMLETLYEFFVCRRIENLSEYFKKKVLLNKDVLINKYKAALTVADKEDVIFQSDKKKYGSIKFPIFIHYIDEFIDDIKASNNDGYEFFMEIINLDVFEEFNDKMKSLLENYGDKIVFIQDSNTVYEKFFSILNIDQFRIYVRNNVLEYFIENESVSGYDGIFGKNRFAQSR